MSKEDVKKFFGTLTNDQAAADELATAQSDDEFIDKVVQVAGARGTTLERADVEAHLAEQRDAASSQGDQEISDEQLEEVAGGGKMSNWCVCIVMNWNPTKTGRVEPGRRDNLS